MRIALRAARRLTVTGGFALAGLLLVAPQALAATPPERTLPDSTIAFVKVQNATALREAFGQSQLGQLWNDPAVKVWKDEISERLDMVSDAIKKELGVTLREFVELPQGPAAIAILKIENRDLPLALMVIADAGKNSATMNDVLIRATKQVEGDGTKISTELFRGVTIHILEITKDEKPAKAKDKENDDEEDDGPRSPIVWANQGSVFFISTDLEAVKDLIAHEQGRDNALASSAAYVEAVKKLGADTSVFWFVDLLKAGKLISEQVTVRADAVDVREAATLVQRIGLGSLKAVTGSFVPDAGNREGISKTMILLQGPAQGLLKAFRLPEVALQPEPWVPASVASYQSISWDLDNAFVVLSELANLIEPGLIDAIQQQLVDPEGGKPLEFKQDIFDPLGDRITIVSDFKKPITENSRALRLALTLKDSDTVGFSLGQSDDARMLVAVALEDSKTFQNTLNKLLGLTGAQPKKREFQGTIIYDFDFDISPRTREDNEGVKTAGRISGTISMAIAKETLFLSVEPTLLEQVLRGGGPKLADSEAYRAFVKELPNRVSSLSYVRPDEQARLTYGMIKNGQFETPLQGTAVRVGPDLLLFTQLFDPKTMPAFSVFAKHLAQAGRFSESTEDGLTITGFSLRKPKR